MIVIDPGHKYLCDSYDGDSPQMITFMKREGEGYPGNVGHHPGTNIQEVIRVIIDRFSYLQNQIPCWQNLMAISLLRHVIILLEDRAAIRHGRVLQPFSSTAENVPVCGTCGHIQCNAHG